MIITSILMNALFVYILSNKKPNGGKNSLEKLPIDFNVVTHSTENVSKNG